MGNQPTTMNELCDVIKKDKKKTVKNCIRNGKLNINDKTNEQTALFVAVLNGRYEIAELLLQHGADPNITCNIQRPDGSFLWSVIHEACRQGSVKMLELILNHHADVNLIVHHRMTPLHIASWHGYQNITTLLIKSGCEVNQTDRFQETALVIPICFGDVAIVTTLLNAGCKLTCRSWGNTRKIRGKYEAEFRESLYGRHGPYTLLLLAIKYSWMNIACLLLQHGFNPNKYQIHDILKNIKSNLGVINQEAITLIHCFLEAGYRFKEKDHCLLENLIDENNHGYDENIIHELMEGCGRVPSLLEISRTTIRSHLRVVHDQRSVISFIKQLFLPLTLTSYLCLEHFQPAIQKKQEDVVFSDAVREPLYFAMPRKKRGFKSKYTITFFQS